MVLTVCGRVGFVDDGMMLANDATVMMSGACPPPAPLGVIAVNRTVADRGERRFNEARFVERVRVECRLDPERFTCGEARIDRRRAWFPSPRGA